MMILNNIRDLKARHSKSMKYLKTIKKDDTKKAFQKSMDEEKRMINALIEMNTTLSRNCAVTDNTILSMKKKCEYLKQK